MNARRAGAAVLLVASGLALAMLCWRGIYVRYNADDFWTASIVARLGFWKSQSFWYERWSGRFSYTFLIGIVESIGPRFVPALVPVVITSWFAATLICTGRLLAGERAESPLPHFAFAADPPGRLISSKLLEDLPVYAVEGPRRHDDHDVVRLRFASD